MFLSGERCWVHHELFEELVTEALSVRSPAVGLVPSLNGS